MFWFQKAQLIMVGKAAVEAENRTEHVARLLTQSWPPVTQLIKVLNLPEQQLGIRYPNT